MGGTGSFVDAKFTNNGEFSNAAAAHASALSQDFGDEVVASWIIPIDGWQSIIAPPTIIGRLHTQVSGEKKNKLVVVASCVGNGSQKEETVVRLPGLLCFIGRRKSNRSAGELEEKVVLDPVD